MIKSRFILANYFAESAVALGNELIYQTLGRLSDQLKATFEIKTYKNGGYTFSVEFRSVTEMKIFQTYLLLCGIELREVRT